MSTSDKGTRLAPPPGRTKTQLGAHTWVTTLLCLLFAIMYLDRGNLSAAAGAIRAQFGLSNTQIGIAFSAFSWAYLASVLFGGWCARRYGARITLLVTVFLVGLGTMATGLATGVVSLFLVRLVVGAGEGPAFPAATHAMRNWYPQRSFGWIQGITHSASRLGGALAPPIVALIIGAFNWQVSFVVCGLASLLWAVLWWSYFRDDPRQHAAVAPQRLHELSAVASTHGPGPVPLWALTRRMLPVTAVMFAYGWCYWIFMSWLPLYFTNQHHQDLRSSAFLSSLTRWPESSAIRWEALLLITY